MTIICEMEIKYPRKVINHMTEKPKENKIENLTYVEKGDEKMEKPKFKMGDNVRVKGYTDVVEAENHGWTEEMVSMVNKGIYTIDACDYSKNCFYLKGFIYRWHQDWLELVEESSEKHQKSITDTYTFKDTTDFDRLMKEAEEDGAHSFIVIGKHNAVVFRKNTKNDICVKVIEDESGWFHFNEGLSHYPKYYAMVIPKYDINHWKTELKKVREEELIKAKSKPSDGIQKKVIQIK